MTHRRSSRRPTDIDKLRERLVSRLESERGTRIAAALRLSPSEQRIIWCCAAGVDTELEMSRKIGMPRRTLHEHFTRLYSKLAIANRADLMSLLWAVDVTMPDARGGDK